MGKLEEGLFREIVSRKAGFEHVLVNLNREGWFLVGLIKIIDPKDVIVLNFFYQFLFICLFV